ncbi:MAG: methionyl-tRNA formyltransferase [Phycisphaerales bacterium]|nr:methionyl-tRNA formyltransferase [Phycisphaerales bacterium]
MAEFIADFAGSVVFLGGGSLGIPCLRELARRGWIDAVVSQPDRPAGRGRVNTPTPLSEAALEYGLKLIRTENANELAVRAQCARAKMLVVISFGQKLSQELIAGRCAINLHPSSLPKWRGAAPIQRAMMAGEEHITACAMAVAQRMDAGEIYARQHFQVGATETAGELHDRIARESVDMMLQTIERALIGALTGEAQIEADATRAMKLSKGEAFVDFAHSARMVRCRIHGLAPWPGCDAEIAGEPIRLLKVQEVAMVGATVQPNANATPGEIVRGGFVSCSEGAIEILQVQPVGRRAMAWADFCRGRSIVTGQRITSSSRKEQA